MTDLLFCSFCYLKYVMTQINAILMLITTVQTNTIKLLTLISHYPIPNNDLLSFNSCNIT